MRTPRSSKVAIHLVTPEYPPAVGGVGDYTRVVARGLAEAGEDVHVWCPPGGKRDASDRFIVHPDLGRFGGDDLERAGRLLDAFDAPRRVIVQWVPHAYGRRAMNLTFCLWLWKRALRGDRIELMVHEPFLMFWEGTWRQTAAALVHRVMTLILLQAARQVWVSIPAWERMWKPYLLGRPVPFRWLPIPTSLRVPSQIEVSTVRQRLTADSGPVVGHFGTYGSAVASMLLEILPAILAEPARPHVLLIGAGSEDFLPRLLSRCPDSRDAVRATGFVPDEALSGYVAACDLLVQPYPDGISARRTSAMAGLFLGVPIVTTKGRLTEAFWEKSGAVRLAPVGDRATFLGHVQQLVEHPEVRRQLAGRARALYDETFDVRLTVAALKTAA
jgi:glycosyltransferase involved in cell wall biosynthesis